MAERDFQAFIARLCVDANARDRFLASDESIFAGHDLTSLERSRLNALQRNAAGLTVLADILEGKRRSRVRSLLPNAASHIAESDWQRLWVDYTATACPVPPARPRQDAATFARWAPASIRTEDPVVSAIFEYDASFNDVADTDGVAAPPPQPDSLADALALAPLAATPRVLRGFAVDVLSLIRHGSRVDRTATTDGYQLMFYRPFGAEGVRVSRVGSETQLLLDRADGARTLETILTSMRPNAAAARRAEGPMEDLLQRMWAAGALCFVPPRPPDVRERP